MGFSVMLWGAEKLVPAKYWCPYGTFTTRKDNVKSANLALSSWIENRHHVVTHAQYVFHDVES